MMSVSRRTALKTLTGAIAAAGTTGFPAIITKKYPKGNSLKGNIRHSVCRWPYGRFSLDELCRQSAEIGIGAIDLLNPEEFETAKKYGLECSMSNGPGSIEKGLNQTENHPELIDGFRRMIPQIAEAGVKNIICFSGNRNGMDDEQGIINCARAIKSFIGLAEQHNITVFMEVLNASVDHPDYHANNVPWTAKIADKVGSDHFKILFDIYHMQVDNGNIISTIRKHSDYIGHYHTAGVPGRNEIDHSQELYYPAVMEAIKNTGFNGWVAQEFIPLKDPWESLYEAVRICDV